MTDQITLEMISLTWIREYNAEYFSGPVLLSCLFLVIKLNGVWLAHLKVKRYAIFIWT